MKNPNIFMARKKQYGTLPTGRQCAKPKRPAQPKPAPTFIERRVQSRDDRGVGNAWWLTILMTPWFKQKVDGRGRS